MALPLISHRKADIISLCVFFVGLMILLSTQTWWPGILLALGTALLVRQYLRGRIYDMVISFIVFGGWFTFFYFQVDWTVVMSVIFTIGGIYLVFREYFVSKERFGVEKIEDNKQELKDEQELEDETERHTS